MVREMINRLRQPRSQEEIVRLATEILSQKPREPAKELFAALNHDPGEDLVTNVLALFGELAKRNPSWVNILEKSLDRKRGRCPKPLVSSMRELLDCGRGEFAAQVPSVRELLADLETAADPPEDQTSFQQQGSGVQVRRTLLGRTFVTIPITGKFSDIARMDGLAALLNLTPRNPYEVAFDFSGVEHIYVIGLTALATWCRKNAINPRFVNASDTTLRYLDLIGFTKAAKGGISPYTETDPSFAMAIKQITSASQPENVASRLVKILDDTMHLSRTAKQGLIVIFAELIENILRHAALDSVAFACAQVYPKRRKLTICVADAGMGVRQSILTSSNETLIKRIEEGESAVELACAPLVTSKPERHSGYGLYVASELVVRNGGTFRIFSGNEIYTRYRKQWQKRENLIEVSDPWNGTWIAMILDLDATISVGDVYVTLPPAPGTELEDFF